MPSSITLTVSHLPTSTSFFLSALQPLDYVYRGRQDQTIGFGPASPATAPPDFWITQEIPGVPAGAAHVAFPASSRAQVEAFFVAALKAGGKIHGEPCQRDGAGYFSAAVIDFDGNSIEAVYRPVVVADKENKSNDDATSVVSQRQGGSSRAPAATAATVVSQAKSKAASTARSVVSIAKAPSTIVSHAKSRGAPSTIVSQAARSTAPPPSQVRSVTAPSQVGSVASHAQPPPQPPQAAPQPSNPSGDLLTNLISEARTAASVARNLVNSVRPNLDSNPTSGSAAAPAADQSGASGAGDAIVGTLLGVAAGAALHYAFSNRSKDSQVQGGGGGGDGGVVTALRPSIVGRNITDPTPLPLRTEYAYGYEYSHSAVGSGVYPYRAIEAGPAMSGYGYANPSHYAGSVGDENDDEEFRSPRLITMHDNDSRSQSSATIRPAAAAASQVSRQSKQSGVSTSTSVSGKMKTLNAPPTSYRAPTVLTAADTHTQAASAVSAAAKSRHSSRSRSLSRFMGLNLNGESDANAGDKASKASSRSRARSHSRVTASSRRSRRDKFDDNNDNDNNDAKEEEDGDEVKTVVNLADHESAGGRGRTTSHVSRSQTHVSSHSHVKSYHTAVHAGSHHSSRRTASRASSHRGKDGDGIAEGGGHAHREPHEYPLPPSRAATWAGSDVGGHGVGSLVSSGRVVPGKHVSAPRTIIGKLNPLRNVGGGGSISGLRGGGGGGHGHGHSADTMSVVSKQKDLADLDVSDREVRPEDSISQISVESRRSKRSSKASWHSRR
ncbi:hypothetical protein A1O3_09270 [Capronia epimyces CBS 606.96]|uniref:VOC domain-containing protein n=1 Tax=Capronia epimyces CBS 606.96 TaxID=1182542 RepID=W9Y6R1_9EURO|nr:uncharacterized protein A1O3_09270 [Capronia epimyces CBS 606.96]EXJ78109.1 hypothetical protein A1O3_09270 [Capronia epimyces CBS 606.96]